MLRHPPGSDWLATIVVSDDYTLPMDTFPASAALVAVGTRRRMGMAGLGRAGGKQRNSSGERQDSDQIVHGRYLVWVQRRLQCLPPRFPTMPIWKYSMILQMAGAPFQDGRISRLLGVAPIDKSENAGTSSTR
jgi:hypothetical protein